MARAFSFIPIYVLLRLDSVEDSTGEASGGKVKVDAMHPGVFVQLQHFLYDLYTYQKKNIRTNSAHCKVTFLRKAELVCKAMGLDGFLAKRQDMYMQAQSTSSVEAVRPAILM